MSLAQENRDERIGEDRLLGGRVRLRQPLTGYRAGTDPVFLAASVPARSGQSVLDLGCGAGAASLCLMARVPGLRVTGVEVQPAYADLARQNAQLNGLPAAGADLDIHVGDVAALPKPLKEINFDHVILNPPFYVADAALASPISAKDMAHRETSDLSVWIATALARLKPQGWLTLIHRTTRLGDVLGALSGTGAIEIKPLAARSGREAKRVVLRARKGVRTPLRLLAPLILHSGSYHEEDRDDFSPEARAVLRDAQAIPF